MQRTGVSRLAAVVLVVVAACGEPVPSPSPAQPGSPTPAPSIATSPTPAPVSTLRVAIDGDLAGGFSNAAAGADAVRIAGFIHDGLFELDERLRPVPVLAAGPPIVSADGRTWTVTVRDDVTFHDGSPLTVDDVVQTYELARSARCTYGPGSCLSRVLESVTRVDEDTVAFTLPGPLAAFGTTGLAVGIESKAAIDAAFEVFLEGAGAVTATETAAYLGAVAAEETDPTGPDGPDGAPTIDHAALRAPGEALLARASLSLPDQADHTTEGAFSEAGYVEAVVARVRAIDATFTSTPIDALAAAYPYLAATASPIGTGPFRLVEPTTDGGVDLASNPAYVLGAPGIERIALRVAASDADAAAALRAGDVDWRPGIAATTVDALAGDPAVRLVEYPEFGFLALYFNLHPDAGGLFVDRNLRQAVALCFDNEATVRAATNGDGLAVYSEIPTMSWAYPPAGLATYPMDRELATERIEASGWELGDDGIYEKGGERLATAVAVREGFPARTDWLNSVSEQVRACGIELTVVEVSFEAILDMLAIYPHVNAAAPDDGDPFDAYFGGLDTGIDPDPFLLYHSSECSTAELPDTYNFACYANPVVDGLIDAGRIEPDLDERARIYHEYAVLQSQDLPVIYAWSELVREGISSTMGTTDPGGLALDTPTWYRQLERLTNVR
jgi:ABC-type transport system substrate-binding protein